MMKALGVFLVFMCTAVVGLGTNAFATENTTTTHTKISENIVDKPECASFFDHTFRKLHSKEKVDLCELTANKTVLLVNTASTCGFTPQFSALEALHQQYKDEGLVVIGFPSADFYQEKDYEKDTAKVCYINYGVTFTMISTTSVRGSDVNPVFAYVSEETVKPKWNFYKYLVSNNGNKIQHFHSRIKPTNAKLINAIEKSLAQEKLF